MFIHPDVDERLDLIGMDPQSRGLLTALIPARSVCGFESQHQALGKVLRLAVVEGRGHRAEHFGAREHLADYPHAHAQDLSGPWRAFRAGMGGACSASLHKATLA